MAVRTQEVLFRGLSELRYHPTEKRVRASLGADTVADTQRAMLVWEPKRPVPQYAVPVSDLTAELAPAADNSDGPSANPVSMLDGPPVLGPDTPFAVHTCPGRKFNVVWNGRILADAGFSPMDPALDGYVVLDFPAFEWREEDESIVSHPRDPFHRVDVRQSSRHVRIERHGQLLAESSRPVLVFETNLPVRFYLQPDDVRTDLLAPSATETACAYKGVATYFSSDSSSQPEDVAWSYQRPLADAAELAGLVAFFHEAVDVTVDGDLRERPRTPWSKRPDSR